MTLPDIQCDIRTSKMREYLDKLNSAARLPLNYIPMAEFLVNTTTSAALQALDSTLDAIADAVNIPEEYMNPLFDMTYAANALRSLRACANIVTDAATAKAMDETINILSDAGGVFQDLPHAFQKYVGNALYRGAQSALNEAVNEHVIGKLHEIRSMYNKMLQSSGITDTLRKVDAILNCAAGACDQVDNWSEKVNGYYEDLYLDDDGNGTDFITQSTKITDTAKKQVVKATLDKLDKIESDIASGLSFIGIDT